MIKFYVAKSRLKNKNGEYCCMVKPRTNFTYTAKVMKEYVERQASIKASDVDAVMDEIKEVAVRELLSNSRVELPGLGCLWLSLKLNGKRNVTNPDDIKPHDVFIRGIEFTPSREFQNAIMHASDLHFDRVPGVAAEDVDLTLTTERITDYGKSHPYITARDCSHLMGISVASARKRLNHLTEGEHPLLRKQRESNVFLYMFNSQH